MSTNRINPAAGFVGKVSKSEAGRPLCRRCKSECPKPRRTFCSDECIHEWKLTSNPGYLRLQVFKRDRGICAECGIDAQELSRQICSVRDWREQINLLKSLGIPTSRYHDPWDADHIVPVAEGGGECGIDNIRTLCIPCHKRVTAALRKRLAEQRKKVKHGS